MIFKWRKKQKNGSSTVCDRNQQKNIKSRKTELKKTGIAPIVQLHQNNRGKAMPVNLYYAQRVRGFQQESVKYSKESVEIRLKRTSSL